MKKLSFILFIIVCFSNTVLSQIQWVHISSKTGAIEAPNTGKQQTSAAVADFDNDGINDFCITEKNRLSPEFLFYYGPHKFFNSFVIYIIKRFQKIEAFFFPVIASV